MESIGSRLQNARLAKELSLDQASRSTHIARRFLTALEEETFDEFPGETYLVGFLNKYAEFLGIESEEIVSLYRNMKLQEEPPPMGELLHDTKQRSKAPLVILIILLVAVVGVGGYLLTTSGVLSELFARSEEQLPGTEVAFTGEALERVFRPNDRIAASAGSARLTILVEAIGETVTIAYAGNREQLSEGAASLIDLDQAGEVDLRISVRSIVRDPSAPSAVLRIDRAVSVPAVDEGDVAPSTSEAQPQTLEPLGSTQVPSRRRDPIVIAEEGAGDPFAVNVSFGGFVLFRYRSDGTPWVQEPYDEGDSVRIDADRRVQVWASDAGETRVVVAGVAVPLGSPGEPASSVIGWSIDDDQRRLVAVPAY